MRSECSCNGVYGALQEVAELLEKAGAAAAAMARETERTPPSARLCLHVAGAADGEQVSVQLLPDNYHDTMVTSLEASEFSFCPVYQPLRCLIAECQCGHGCPLWTMLH